jgi:hypothetical protein
MAHVFDGTWNSTTINTNGNDDDDGRFELTIDPGTGDINEGSKHISPRGRETPVTGTTKRGRFQRITIFRGADTYEGALLPSNDKSLWGLQNLDLDGFDQRGIGDADEAERVGGQATASRERVGSQEQAIWVATKP